MSSVRCSSSFPLSAAPVPPCKPAHGHHAPQPETVLPSPFAARRQPRQSMLGSSSSLSIHTFQGSSVFRHSGSRFGALLQYKPAACSVQNIYFGIFSVFSDTVPLPHPFLSRTDHCPSPSARRHAISHHHLQKRAASRTDSKNGLPNTSRSLSALPTVITYSIRAADTTCGQTDRSACASAPSEQGFP